MQPLPLTRAQWADYYALLASPQDFSVSVDVLHMDESPRGSLTAQFVDGQVNLQRDATVKRTATFSFYDPDHSLHLDAGSPFEGAVFADRMIRVRHTVTLADGTKVTATPFVGPVTKVSRAGDNLSVECQDKTLLAVEGSRPKHVAKGRNAVAAIRDIMSDCTGERRFRFPAHHSARITKKAGYTVGWTSEASPWAVCQKIADSIHMDLFYACDGALVLRKRSQAPVISFAVGGLLTSEPTAEYDMTSVRNLVRVTGERRVKKDKKATKDKKGADKKHKFTEDAAAPRRHPMSAQNLGRNGSPRWLPLLVDDSSIHTNAAARQRAQAELAKALPLGVSVNFSGVPVFHLDYGDTVKVSTDFGTIRVPFFEASIPLGSGGDESVGVQRRVSRPRRS